MLVFSTLQEGTDGDPWDRAGAVMLTIPGMEKIELLKFITGFGGRSDLRQVAFHGGGGTDFTPLLQAADEHDPDIGVVLTDLEGPARFRPRWPVIWAVPEKQDRAVAPFGRKLSLD